MNNAGKHVSNVCDLIVIGEWRQCRAVQVRWRRNW